MYCGAKLITEGTTRAEVAARCGQPAQIDLQTMYSEADTVAGGVPPLYRRRSSSEIPVEFWTYNFGSAALMKRIRFENGVAVRIDSLGYGF